MCTRALCSSSSFSLCVMRLQLAFDFDLQLAHGCAHMSKNGFSATIFLNALFLISTFMKSHCTPCSFTVVMSILSSRPKYPSRATLSPKRWSCVSDWTCSQLPVTLHFHLHPIALYPLNLLFEHRQLVSWTVDFQGPWLVLCLHWRMKHHLAR